MSKILSRWLAGGLLSVTLCAAAQVQTHKFDISAGDLKAALDAYMAQSGAQLIFKPEDVKGRVTKGLHRDLTPEAALKVLLEDTSLSVRTDASGAMVIFVEPPKKDESRADATDAVDQVVIVAVNKRPQKNRDIAGTVTSFSGDSLEQDGIKDAESVFLRAPGIQANKGDPDLSMPTIRGIGTATNANTIGLQQATTGIYINDVPFTDPIAVNLTPDLAPFDLEGIDILRGPQGALYGSSSLGGAIRYTLKNPDLTKFDASVLADVGAPATGGVDHSEYAMVNVPLSMDVAALRAVAFDRDQAGYIDNTGTGVSNANTLRQQGGRLMGALKVDPTLKINGFFLYQKTSIGDGFSVSPSADSLTNSSPTPSTRDDNFSLGQLAIEKQLGMLTFSSNTSEVTKRIHNQSDVTKSWSDIGTFDNLPLLPEVSGPAETVTHAFSQEFRVAGSIPDTLNFVAGAFYQSYHATYDTHLNAPGGAALFGPALVPNDVLYTEDDLNQTEERALFADVEYEISNRLSVDLGGRYYRNSQSATYNSHLLDALFGAVPTLDVANSEDGFTPKLNVKYKFDSAMWYATASEGYRFGGVNPGVNTVYKSDALWNYETGFRYFPSKTFSFDGDIFRVDWRDAQMNALVGTGASAVNGIANVGRAKIDGAEMKIVWRPVHSLTLQSSATWLDAVTAVDFTSYDGTIVPAGSRLPGSAKFQSSEEIEYRFDGINDSAGRLALTHSYVGSRQSNLDRPGVLDPYQVFDLRCSMTWSNYEVAGYINNIGNSHGASGGSTVRTLGGNYYDVYFPIMPRVVGISIRYDY